MRVLVRLGAEVLVWVAALSIPLGSLVTGACGCADVRSAGSIPAPRSAPCAHGCCGRLSGNGDWLPDVVCGVSTVHRVQGACPRFRTASEHKAAASSCCERAHRVESAPGCRCPSACSCRQTSAPAPIAPPSNHSPSGKGLSFHSVAVAVFAAPVEVQTPEQRAAVASGHGWATPLERCRSLCRFLL
jgi:hypothetical protein